MDSVLRRISYCVEVQYHYTITYEDSVVDATCTGGGMISNKKSYVKYSLLWSTIVENYGTMELWLSMENCGTWCYGKNYDTM